MARDREFTPEEREEIRRRSLERRARRAAENGEAGAQDRTQGRARSRAAAQQGEAQRRTTRTEGQAPARRRSVNEDQRRQAARAQQARPATAQERRANVQPSDPNRYSRTAAAYQAPKKGSPVKTIVAIVIALVVIATLAFGVYSLFLKPASTGTDANAGGNTTSAPASTPFSVGDTKSQVNSPEAEEAITLTLKGDHDTIVLKGESYIEPGAHAVERRSGDISLGIKTEGKVDTSKAGDYTVTYTATSSDGLKVSRTRTVHVVESMDKDTDGIPVLMYHYVYSDAKGYHPDGAESNSNYILDTDLAEQLDYLVKNDYYFPSYAELAAYVAGTHSLPAKSVILTFDDGSPDFLTYGIPMLEQYKVPATSFLVGVDNFAPCVQCPSEYVTYQSHSYDMHHAGGDYGHGGAIGGMSQAEIVADLQTNIGLLGSSDAFAYPYGDAPEWGIAAVHEAGVLCAFTTNYEYVHVGDDSANLSRIRVLGTYSLDSFVSSLG